MHRPYAMKGRVVEGFNGKVVGLAVVHHATLVDVRVDMDLFPGSPGAWTK